MSMSRINVSFGLLVAAQSAHSVEEYLGKLWQSFPPAAFLTGLVSPDREFGFIVINAAIVTFGVWCLFWPVRRNWASAPAIMWFWILVETINGIGHPAWSVLQGRYTPGVITAPALLGFAAYLAIQLRGAPRTVAPAA
jgi:hypothetical protein